MLISIASGKGGTGKTTIVGALAHLAAKEHRIVLADADVDAANLELLLSPRITAAHDFVGSKVAVIDRNLCLDCGVCKEACRFGAIPAHDGAHQVDPTACEGCAVCFCQYGAQAMRMDDRLAGRWFRAQTRFGPLFHARLFAGQENSGKLVTQVRQSATRGIAMPRKR